MLANVAQSPRRRNCRGQGALLRDEILSAATRVIDLVDSEADVSLRAIAREAGIAAPSVYAHFEDRAAILSAVVERSWLQLVGDIRIASVSKPGSTDRDRLVRGCQAYVAFARQFPLRYALMTRATAVTPAAREALDV